MPTPSTLTRGTLPPLTAVLLGTTLSFVPAPASAETLPTGCTQATSGTTTAYTCTQGLTRNWTIGGGDTVVEISNTDPAAPGISANVTLSYTGSGAVTMNVKGGRAGDDSAPGGAGLDRGTITVGPTATNATVTVSGGKGGATFLPTPSGCTNGTISIPRGTISLKGGDGGDGVDGTVGGNGSTGCALTATAGSVKATEGKGGPATTGPTTSAGRGGEGVSDGTVTADLLTSTGGDGGSSTGYGGSGGGPSTTRRSPRVPSFSAAATAATAVRTARAARAGTATGPRRSP